jgi:hypothetical protein
MYKQAVEGFYSIVIVFHMQDWCLGTAERSEAPQPENEPEMGRVEEMEKGGHHQCDLE